MSSDNEIRIASSIIDNKYAGYRVDNYLSEKFDYHSRNIWQQLIENNLISINKKSCKPSKKLHYGDVVEFIIENFEEPESNLDYKIVYQDEHILAVDKPHNCIIHPVGPFFKNTLSYKLEHDLKMPLFSVNRLDRETTGLVLFGKTSKDAALLSEYFINRKIYKEYIVAVHGHFPDSLATKGYLFRDYDSTVRKKRMFEYSVPEHVGEEYETSETDFELIENGMIRDIAFKEQAKFIPDSIQVIDTSKGQVIPGSRLLPDARIDTLGNIRNQFTYTDDASLVKVMLKTGRQHQIRATLCSLGFPVIGDKLYGVDDTIYLRFIERKLTPMDKALLILSHQALHSRKMVFTHPYRNEEITIEAELPVAFHSLIK